ncbi:MAG: hypothetical protein KAG66_05500, partial [Methylococcales bacterium]|nr:hypothetical protein [Methylococcales bacterium]
MRQVILDPQETDVPDSEQFVGITTASKLEYKDIYDFIASSGDHFPFNKIDSLRRHTTCSSEDLLRFIAPIKETYSEENIPLPTAGG